MTALSFDEIDVGLYIGNRSSAENVLLLQELNIKKIITVDIKPMKKQHEEIQYIYFYAVDDTDCDILKFFDECYSFIGDKTTRDSACLVHCLEGCSRSATIAAAYMMKKYSLSYCAVLDMIKAKRPSVWPNSGFVCQLKLYEEMNWSLRRDNILYHNYLLENLSRRVLHNSSQVKESLEEFWENAANMDLTSEVKSYKCKKCRTMLFATSNLLCHYDGINKPQQGAPSVQNKTTCQSTYFIEPMTWMLPQISQEELHGKLLCPNCSAKLGAYRWLGITCDCGSTITPGFRINASRVDKSCINLKR